MQVGSALAYRAIPLQAAYCAAKFAIRGFTDSLRCELLHDGSRVRVTTVHLPAHQHAPVRAGAQPLPRHPRPVPPIYQPEVAARAIVSAADRGGRERWVGRRRSRRSSPSGSPRPCSTATSRAPATTPSRPASRWTRGPPATTSTRPLPGDRGAHGRFDEAAAPVSRTAWAREHLDLIAAGAAALATAGWIVRR